MKLSFEVCIHMHMHACIYKYAYMYIKCVYKNVDKKPHVNVDTKNAYKGWLILHLYNTDIFYIKVNI